MPRTWFITGCSQGLGKSLARVLLERGEKVVATARNPDSMTDLQSIGSDNLWTAQLDVTKPEQVKSVVAGAIDHFGRIDVLVNNAGYGLRGAAEEVSDDEFRAILETDLVAPMALSREFIPHFRENGGGHIFQVSSQGGQIAFPGLGAYHAAKWGLEGYSESMAKEVNAFNIGVTIVQPGGIRTEWGGASMQFATALPHYDDTPFGQARKTGRRGQPVGDADKMAVAIAESMSNGTPPLRLHLGSDTIRNVSAALEERLAQLHSQEASAVLTDADPA